jgi:hypothetical protein
MNIHVTFDNKPSQEKKSIYQANSDKTKAPYYDPRDIHVHQWKKGNIVPQNSKDHNISKLSQDKKQYDVLYCEICHEIKQTVGNSSGISSVYKIDNIKNSQKIQGPIENSLTSNLLEDRINIIDSVFKNTPSELIDPVFYKKKKNNSQKDLLKIVNSGLFIKKDCTDQNGQYIMFIKQT